MAQIFNFSDSDLQEEGERRGMWTPTDDKSDTSSLDHFKPPLGMPWGQELSCSWPAVESRRFEVARSLSPLKHRNVVGSR